MQAYHLIDKQLITFSAQDTVAEAVDYMVAFSLSEVYLAEAEMLTGVVELQQIINLNSPAQNLGNYQRPLAQSVAQTTEYQEVITLFDEGIRTSFPVIDNNQKWLGNISWQSLVDFIARSISVQQPGGSVLIEVDPIDYSPEEIARISESESAKIIGLQVFEVPDSRKIRVLIKFNTFELDRAILGLERFGYLIVQAHKNQEGFLGMEDRYAALMKYLDD